MRERKEMVERGSDQLSVRRQCELLAVNRNRLEAPPKGPRKEDLEVCRLMDEIHLRAPAFGARKIIWIDPADEADILATLQADLRRKVGARGITVEVNPTSNLLIGDLDESLRLLEFAAVAARAFAPPR